MRIPHTVQHASRVVVASRFSCDCVNSSQYSRFGSSHREINIFYLREPVVGPAGSGNGSDPR